MRNTDCPTWEHYHLLGQQYLHTVYTLLWPVDIDTCRHIAEQRQTCCLQFSIKVAGGKLNLLKLVSFQFVTRGEAGTELGTGMTTDVSTFLHGKYLSLSDGL